MGLGQDIVDILFSVTLGLSDVVEYGVAAKDVFVVGEILVFAIFRAGHVKACPEVGLPSVCDVVGFWVKTFWGSLVGGCGEVVVKEIYEACELVV